MKRGQVWIETVIYTLIAFVMIGSVLAYVKPKVEEIQDKAIIEQSIGMMEDINTIILSLVHGGAGNKRKVELGIKKGILMVDGVNNKLIFEIESRSTYSEPGEDIYAGNILIHTEKNGKLNIVTLVSDYSGVYNITFENEDVVKTLSKGSTPYRMFISNDGKVGGLTVLNFEVD